ncbi:MAG: EAL domain-containing protein [Thermaerobacter sp.]|nr:EAL domain-containing protein [Thermaerobacter sp.]
MDVSSILPSHSVLWREWRTSGSLDVVFQPIVALHSGEVTAYEALSRPRDAAGRPLSVSALLQAATTKHELELFDQFALPVIFDAASRQTWPSGTLLFVNLSPHSLTNPQWLLGLLRQSAFPAEQLVLEVSERENLPNRIPPEVLLAPWRQRGIRVALDDLGAGYSGLNRLVALRPDYAKIDIELVRAIDRNPVKSALVESTVRFSSKTGILSLIAEGIETAAELETLRDIGVEAGQGFYLGRPTKRLGPRVLKIIAHTARPTPGPHEQLQTIVRTAEFLLAGNVASAGFLTHLVYEVKRLLGADVAAFLEHGPQGLTVAESSPVAPAGNRTIRLMVGSNLQRALTERKTVVFQAASEAGRSAFDSVHQLASAMITPICHRQGCWGLLHLGFYQPNRIRPDMIDVAENIARLLGLGFEPPAGSNERT